MPGMNLRAEIFPNFDFQFKSQLAAIIVPFELASARRHAHAAMRCVGMTDV